MKECPRANKCQYGHAYMSGYCGLNDDEPCYKEIEEMEMAEIAVDMYYAGGVEDYE